MRASGRLRTVLVRERDDDQEHDHNEGDRISIKPFPIDVDTHRTALLFAEATTTISLSCCCSNSAPAMREAQQHFGCAALVRSKFVSGKPPGSTIPFAPDRRHSKPDVLGRGRYSCHCRRPALAPSAVHKPA